MSMDKVDFEKYIEVANSQVNYALKEFISKVSLLLLEVKNKIEECVENDETHF